MQCSIYFFILHLLLQFSSFIKDTFIMACIVNSLQEKLNKGISVIVDHREQYVKSSSDFTRNRSMGFERMLKTILGLQGKTLDKEMHDLGENIITASAFVQGRNKIKPEAFEDLYHDFTASIPNQKNYKGYHILAVDGSDISTPKNKDSIYFCKGIKKQTGGVAEFYNMAHLHAIYDVVNKIYVDAIVTPKAIVDGKSSAMDIGERAVANRMIDRYNGPKAILTADRGYPGYNLLEHVNRNPNMEFLIRVPNRNTFKEITELPLADIDKVIEVTVSTKSMQHCKIYGYRHVDGPSPFGKDKKKISWDFGNEPCKIRYRVVRFKIANRGDESDWETIVTSLTRFQFSAKDIKELYHMRWGIENSFRELKYNVGVVNFHAKKDESVLQEIYASLTMYNYAVAVAMSVNIPKNDARVHLYKVNFTMAIYIVLNYFRSKVKRKATEIETEIQRYIAPVRPGRRDKRNLVAKGSVSFLYRVA